jgi:hypothetical protein
MRNKEQKSFKWEISNRKEAKRQGSAQLLNTVTQPVLRLSVFAIRTLTPSQLSPSMGLQQFPARLVKQAPNLFFLSPPYSYLRAEYPVF